MTRPRDCPRWDGCSAPVCPLDAYWRDASHLSGERACGLLCELAKDGGEARLRGALPAALVDTLADVAPLVAARWYPVRKAMRRASRSSSRMEAGQRLARWQGVRMQDAGPPLADVPDRGSSQVVPGNPLTCDRVAKARA